MKKITKKSLEEFFMPMLKAELKLYNEINDDEENEEPKEIECWDV